MTIPHHFPTLQSESKSHLCFLQAISRWTSAAFLPQYGTFPSSHMGDKECDVDNLSHILGEMIQEQENLEDAFWDAPHRSCHPQVKHITGGRCCLTATEGSSFHAFILLSS